MVFEVNFFFYIKFQVFLVFLGFFRDFLIKQNLVLFFVIYCFNINVFLIWKIYGKGFNEWVKVFGKFELYFYFLFEDDGRFEVD